MDIKGGATLACSLYVFLNGLIVAELECGPGESRFTPVSVRTINFGCILTTFTSSAHGNFELVSVLGHVESRGTQ